MADLLSETLLHPTAQQQDREPHELLSDREFFVFVNIAAGKSQVDIAGELSLSVKTVASYRSRILKKLGLKTNAEMILYASRNGLV